MWQRGSVATCRVANIQTNEQTNNQQTNKQLKQTNNQPTFTSQQKINRSGGPSIERTNQPPKQANQP